MPSAKSTVEGVIRNPKLVKMENTLSSKADKGRDTSAHAEQRAHNELKRKTLKVNTIVNSVDTTVCVKFQFSISSS